MFCFNFKKAMKKDKKIKAEKRMSAPGKRGGENDQDKINNEKRSHVNVEPLETAIQGADQERVNNTIPKMYWTGGCTLIEPCNAGKFSDLVNLFKFMYVI